MPPKSQSTDDSQFLDATQNPCSVFYLHPSDNTFIKLVSHPLPYGGNVYSDWKRNIIIGLTSKHKMAFVDGCLTKPALNSSNYKAWINAIIW